MRASVRGRSLKACGLQAVVSTIAITTNRSYHTIPYDAIFYHAIVYYTILYYWNMGCLGCCGFGLFVLRLLGFGVKGLRGFFVTLGLRDFAFSGLVVASLGVEAYLSKPRLRKGGWLGLCPKL